MAGGLPLIVAVVHVAAHELLLLAAVGFAIFGLDDLFVDAVFFARWTWRRLTIYRRHPRADAALLASATPGAMAIIVPAWDEAAVIGAMLRDLTGRLDYRDYRVFVGIYPNDPATLAAVEAVGDARLAAVIGPRPGPTTKADCLNSLWDALLAHEAAAGRRFKAVVLHDAEDVIHPRELAVFDHLMPRLAMVQLPVVPLPDPASRWVSGHYLDEFAEHHGKDMLVREALGAAVPSAGVACAIDRAMLGRIAAGAGGKPFDAACLTEDYELGLRVKALGGRGALVRIRDGGDGAIVATREHFPATLEAALRQKSRWLTGIALAGWDRLGWRGGLADRFMLLRDRKAIPAALIVLTGYAAALLVLLNLLIGLVYPLPRLVAPGSLLAALLWWNAALLGWRLGMRAGFTTGVYGWREGLRAIPRAIAGNYINARAAWRAVWRYRGLVRRGGTLAWDKTVHRFPGAAAG